MKILPYHVVDVFATQPLKGNPVAVFTNIETLSSVEMQAIAKELNLSETTFVAPADNGRDFNVRIFTPVNELPFAGHPTLGTACLLYQLHQKPRFNLLTKMGAIPFEIKVINDDIIQAKMQQPIPTWVLYDKQAVVLEALGVSTSTLPVEIYHNGPRHVFVGLGSIESLSMLKPNLNLLATLPDVAINCFSKNTHGWQMRMFSPAYGVAEDAATGSAAGPLALHLARYGLIPYGENIQIRQGVEMGRDSVMYATVVGSSQKIDSITVSGSAVIVAKGEFFIN